MLVSFAKSVQGESHKRRENQNENLEIGRKFPCQDKSFACKDIIANDGTVFSFAIVCDGHGGAPYFRSEIGADFAIEVLKDMLVRNMSRIVELASSKEYEKIKMQLAIGITKRWRERVNLHISENPITDKEYSFLETEKPEIVKKYKDGKDLYSIYGCTIIAYFSTNSFWYALQIGDGDFSVSYDGTNFELPMPEDKNCFLNQTTSICDDNAKDEFRYCYGERLPIAVFCSSDGVGNSFKDSESLKQKFYLPIYNLFDSTEFPKCKTLCSNSDCDINCHLRIVYEEIFSFLPVLSKKGSGDDISLAGIIDIDKNRILAIRYYIRGIKNIGIPSGNTAGHKLLKKAADLGYEKAQYEYGCLCYNKSSQHKMCEQRLLSKSQQYLEEAKENGIKEATILLNEIFGTAFQNRLNDMEERIDVEIQSRSEK
jgi:hypothetical protein